MFRKCWENFTLSSKHLPRICCFISCCLMSHWHVFISILFVALLQTARERKNCGLDPLDFAEAATLKSCGMKNELFDGEDEIAVEDLLTCLTGDVNGEQKHYFKSLSGTWMPYDFLLGKDPCSVE